MATADVMSCVLPQFFPADWLDPPGMIFSDFPSRIRIGYVLRQEGAYSYVCDENFSTLCISVQELHNAALANLAKLGAAEIKIAKVPGGSEGWIVATDDNFAAARILLPKVQDIFSKALGEEFLVTLPHRDDCFCWSPKQSEEWQEKNARNALGAFLEDDYNLTPDILRFSRGGFGVYRQQSMKGQETDN